MGPYQQYQDDITQHGLRQDPAQYQAVQALQRLYEEINQRVTDPPSFWRRLLRREPITKGLYLVGSVGRGKTYLMDMFYESLEGVKKQRVHYHRFMLDIHEKLKHLPRSPNPLPIVGKDIAMQTQILCLDEFHVTDVADAMLLSGLLDALFCHKVVLVATSNTAIDDLYLNGLQRERFMEAIQLLNTHTTQVDLANGEDYRLSYLEKGETFLVTEYETNTDWLMGKFNDLAPTKVEREQYLTIHHRHIHALAVSDDIVWFDFSELCKTPRAAKDYLELAKLFHTVLVSNIPVLKAGNDSEAKRFMHLIDALYDHRVKLIATARARPEELYQGRLLKDSFDRTVSRLIEMSSHDYLMTPHRI